MIFLIQYFEIFCNPKFHQKSKQIPRIIQHWKYDNRSEVLYWYYFLNIY